MNGNVKPHELDKRSIVTKTEQGGEIVRVVFLQINWWELSTTIDIAVYAARDTWQLRDPGVCAVR